MYGNWMITVGLIAHSTLPLVADNCSCNFTYSANKLIEKRLSFHAEFQSTPAHRLCCRSSAKRPSLELAHWPCQGVCLVKALESTLLTSALKLRLAFMAFRVRSSWTTAVSKQTQHDRKWADKNKSDGTKQVREMDKKLRA
eukprot:1141473-Pelagomonas_calceolata.AAC.4